MDLALLVYGISVVSGLPWFLSMIGLMAIGTVFGYGLYTAFQLDTITHYGIDKREKRKEELKGKVHKRAFLKVLKVCVVVFLCIALLRVIIPSEKTMYLMVGAYTAQKVAENPDVQRISGKVITVIEKKLDEYVDDATKEVEKAVNK